MSPAARRRTRGEKDMIDPLRDPKKAPIRQKAEAVFLGTCHLRRFIDETITSQVAGALQRTSLEEALAGTHRRIAVWMWSLEKLNDASDVQAVCAGARSVFELLIDLAELSEDHGNGERYHAFTLVERVYDAKLRVAFADASTKSDPSLAAQEREYISRKTVADQCDQLLDRFSWRKPSGDPAWPKHWSRVCSLPARCRKLGAEYERLYRFSYKRLSWYVHGGLVGIGGMDDDGLWAAFGWAHAHTQDVVRRALDIVCREFRLFDAIPGLRETLNDTSSAAGLALIDLMRRQESDGGDRNA
jgi:hypothetical protein